MEVVGSAAATLDAVAPGPTPPTKDVPLPMAECRGEVKKAGVCERQHPVKAIGSPPPGKFLLVSIA